jgi:tRNA1(Val) A37 N6-methylase TrmN6
MQENNGVVLNEYEVLEDMMIDGLKIVQDTRLYRFTSDSVLLSKFAKAKKGDKVADFCAGSGIVAFHFHALNKEKLHNLQYTLFEMQKDLSDLSAKTAKWNNFENFEIVNCRLQDLTEKPMRNYHETFSLVLCNPPYEKQGVGFDNDEYHKAVCRKEITLTLKEIAVAASYALKFGGRLCMLHRADRLSEVCYTLHEVNIEVKKIQFVGGRYGTKPYLVMIEGVKGGKPCCDILDTIYNV